MTRESLEVVVVACSAFVSSVETEARSSDTISGGVFVEEDVDLVVDLLVLEVDVSRERLSEGRSG